MGILKAIQNSFKAKGVSIYQSLTESKWETIFGSDRKASLMKKFETSAYVYACVNKRCEKISQINFEVRDKKTDEVVESDIIDLLNKPNSYQDKSEFLYTIQALRDLTGEAYIYIEKNALDEVEALHPLNPSRIKPIFDNDNLKISHYEYTKKQGTTRYEVDEIIVFRYPKPTDFLRGQSPLVAGYLPVETEEQLALYHHSILKNGGRVEGIMKTKARLDEEQVKSMRSQFQEKLAGAEKSGIPLILHGDMEYVNLGLNPTELSYLKSKNLSRDDIFMLFGIPKVILSQTDGVNYANAKVGIEVFLKETIKPLVDAIVHKLGTSLVTDEDQYLTYKSFIPRDEDLQIRKNESGINAGYLTINEVRAIEGYEPVEGGDVIYIPFNKVPLGEESQYETPAKEQKT